MLTIPGVAPFWTSQSDSATFRCTLPEWPRAFGIRVHISSDSTLVADDCLPTGASEPAHPAAHLSISGASELLAHCRYYCFDSQGSLEHTGASMETITYLISAYDGLGISPSS